MSIQAVAHVLQLGPEVRGTARMVLVSLANHAGDDWECWPSVATIASEAGCHVDTAKGALSWLIDEGYVLRSIQSAPDSRIPGNRRPNLYQLTIGTELWTTTEQGVVNHPSQAAQGGVIHGSGGGDLPSQGGVNRPPKPSLNHQRTAPTDPTDGDNPSLFAPGSGRIEEFVYAKQPAVERAEPKEFLDAARRRLHPPNAGGDDAKVEQ